MITGEFGKERKKTMRGKHRGILAAATAVAVSAVTAAGVVASPLAQAAPGSSFIGRFHTITTIASTVPTIIGPGNGDVNPYGVAVVRRSEGRLVRGDVLVSNFNNSDNLQGTGTTIVEISSDGGVHVFAQISAKGLPGACPGGIGLTTALSILNNGWVVVGSLPTIAGNPATMQAGCLLVLNDQGKVVTTFSGRGINGPWDMTAVNFGRVSELFVTNVLNGTVEAALKAGIDPSKTPGPIVNGGTVLRLLVTTPPEEFGKPRLLKSTVIGSRFGERTDPDALVIGPTGVGLGENGELYVADTLGNRIAGIKHALIRHTSARTGFTVSVNGSLNGPLGLAIAPNDNILTTNGGDGFLVETSPHHGRQVARVLLDSSGSPPGAGALFGLAIAPHRKGVYFVDDASNTLNILH
jgi:hypothetical protein